MKPVILYYSKTGFTEQYAKWMAKELSCPAFPFKRRDTVDFSRYDTIIFGSWCHAGQLKKIRWFRGMMPKWGGKQKILFAVGASPAENPQIEMFLKSLTVPEEQVRAFYLPGGLRYEKMGVVSRAMMKLFVSIINKKKEKTPEEEKMVQMLCHSYDISDRSHMAPVLETVRENVEMTEDV